MQAMIFYGFLRLWLETDVLKPFGLVTGAMCAHSMRSVLRATNLVTIERQHSHIWT
jgi:hypothetical protein